MAEQLWKADYGIGLEWEHWSRMDKPLPLPPCFSSQFRAFMLLQEASRTVTHTIQQQVD
jgi:hypothetical protein